MAHEHDGMPEIRERASGGAIWLLILLPLFLGLLSAYQFGSGAYRGALLVTTGGGYGHIPWRTLVVNPVQTVFLLVVAWGMWRARRWAPALLTGYAGFQLAHGLVSLALLPFAFHYTYGIFAAGAVSPAATPLFYLSIVRHLAAILLTGIAAPAVCLWLGTSKAMGNALDALGAKPSAVSQLPLLLRVWGIGAVWGGLSLLGAAPGARFVPGSLWLTDKMPAWSVYVLASGLLFLIALDTFERRFRAFQISVGIVAVLTSSVALEVAASSFDVIHVLQSYQCLMYTPPNGTLWISALLFGLHALTAYGLIIAGLIRIGPLLRPEKGGG